MITYIANRTLQIGSLQIGSPSSIQGGAEAAVDEIVNASTTNEQFAFAVAAAKIVALYILSTVAMTIKTNSSGAPVNTFTLAAGVPYLWLSGDPPITDSGGTALANITTIYVTNPGGVNGNLSIRCLYNPN